MAALTSSKQKRPFREDTILACAKGRARPRLLDDGSRGRRDFTGCDTALLNQFFRDYHDAHTRGGTNTRQRNLRHLFSWLEAEYDHPHPYTDDLNRYAAAAGWPSPLSEDFIKDLLVVAGGGHGKTFADIRDHALSGSSPRSAVRHGSSSTAFAATRREGPGRRSVQAGPTDLAGTAGRARPGTRPAAASTCPFRAAHIPAASEDHGRWQHAAGRGNTEAGSLCWRKSAVRPGRGTVLAADCSLHEALMRHVQLEIA